MKVDPVQIGLTGGIGSGKSTVAAMFQKLGAVIIDADAISRTATASHGSAMSDIAATFGSEFVTPDGALNRQKMRAKAFKDPAFKQKLEHILHPLVRNEMMVQADFAISRGATCVVFDIPLLAESSVWRHRLDFILIVDCAIATQVLRVRKRNGLSDEEVRSIISAQASRSYRLQIADVIVFNDGCSLEQLAAQVQAIASEIGL